MNKIINGYEIKPKADLRGADLRGADLRGADLQGTTLWEANLQDAIIFTGWEINKTP